MRNPKPFSASWMTLFTILFVVVEFLGSRQVFCHWGHKISTLPVTRSCYVDFLTPSLSPAFFKRKVSRLYDFLCHFHFFIIVLCILLLLWCRLFLSGHIACTEKISFKKIYNHLIFKKSSSWFGFFLINQLNA